MDMILEMVGMDTDTIASTTIGRVDSRHISKVVRVTISNTRIRINNIRLRIKIEDTNNNTLLISSSLTTMEVDRISINSNLTEMVNLDNTLIFCSSYLLSFLSYTYSHTYPPHLSIAQLDISLIVLILPFVVLKFILFGINLSSVIHNTVREQSLINANEMKTILHNCNKFMADEQIPMKRLRRRLNGTSGETEIPWREADGEDGGSFRY